MSGFEDRMRGYKKENLVGDSDSDDEQKGGARKQGGRAEPDGATGGATASFPLPSMDGMPKVSTWHVVCLCCSVSNCLISWKYV